MRIGSVISAFAQRGARRGTAATLLLYSALIAIALLTLAALIAPSMRESDALTREYVLSQPAGYHIGADPALWTTLALADVFACFLLAFAGFVATPALVTAAVATERRHGTLDQLRTTPLSPLGLALGMLAGVPTRLYLLCGGPLALHLAAMLCGTIPFAVGVQSLVVLVAGTMASAAIGLTVALAPRQDSGGTLSALIVAGALFAFGLLTAAFAAARSYDQDLGVWSYLHPAGAFDAVMLQSTGLWRRMVFGAYGDDVPSPYTAGAPMASVLASLVLTVLLLYSACRRLGAPERPLFGKRHAMTMFAFAAAAFTLPALLAHGSSPLGCGAVAGLSALMIGPLVVLGLCITPSGEAWTVALRRGARPRWHADDASPHRALWLMTALWLGLMVTLHGVGVAHDIVSGHGVELAWLALLAAALPCFLLFASTRYSTAAARWAFGVAVGVYFACQIIAAVCVADRALRGLESVLVTIAAIAAVVVPAIVVLRQRALARSLLAEPLR